MRALREASALVFIDYGYGIADGGSCATGTSTFTMVVVGSEVSVLGFVRKSARQIDSCELRLALNS